MNIIKQPQTKKLPALTSNIEPGRCYWYNPQPLARDYKCRQCKHLFASDYSDPPSIVLVVHPVRTGTARCPICGYEANLPRSKFFRCERINILRKDVAIVQDKWLTPATSEDVAMYCIAAENIADEVLGRPLAKDIVAVEAAMRFLGIDEVPLNFGQARQKALSQPPGQIIEAERRE